MLGFLGLRPLAQLDLRRARLAASSRGLSVFEAGFNARTERLGTVQTIAAIGLGGLIFVTLLAIAWPWPETRRIELWLSQAAVVTLALGIASALVKLCPPPLALRIFAALATGSCLALFAVPLAIAWETGLSNGSIFGGLIPYSDAAGYMDGAWRLLAEGELGFWNMRRPINAALHALRFAVSGGDLMISLVLTAWLVGLASLLAAAYIRRDFGWTAAIVFFITWFLFVDEWLSITLSEAHGCLIGAIGFALIWQAAKNGHPITFGLGMTLLSLALAARAGPFFMLPLLLLWGAVYLGSSWHRRAIAAVAGIIGLGVGQGIPRLFNALWGVDTNVLYSNFAHTFYGMTKGGLSWTAIHEERPEIFEASQGETRELVEQIYQASFDNIMESPELFFGFIARELARFPEFLTQSLLLPPKVGDFWSWLLIIGCVWVVLTLRKPVSGLLIAGMAGLWLSSPALMLDGGHRVFAAGVPWLAAIVAIGAFALVKLAATLSSLVWTGQAGIDHGREAPGISRGGPWLADRFAIGVGCITLLIAVAGPVLAVSLYPGTLIQPTRSCPADQTERLIRPAAFAATIHAQTAGEIGKTRTPIVQHPDYFKDLPLDLIPLMAIVAKETPPYSLSLTYDLLASAKGHTGLFFGLRKHDVDPLPATGLVSVCVTPLCPNCSLFDIRSWHRISDD